MKIRRTGLAGGAGLSDEPELARGAAVGVPGGGCALAAEVVGVAVSSWTGSTVLSGASVGEATVGTAATAGAAPDQSGGSVIMYISTSPVPVRPQLLVKRMRVKSGLALACGSAQ